jgi:hypothetical protein
LTAAGFFGFSLSLPYAVITPSRWGKMDIIEKSNFLGQVVKV